VSKKHPSPFQHTPKHSRPCGARAVATADEQPRTQAEPGGVFARMEGSPVLELAAGTRVVPIMTPDAHRVPFAMALRIIDPGTAPAQVLGMGDPARRDTLELFYVLGGAGALLGAGGAEQPVVPGDTIAAQQGSAMFVVPATAADGGNGVSANAPAPLVMLQLLLPGKLLRDVAAGERTAFSDPSELGIAPDWEAPAVIKAGRLSKDAICSLLTHAAMPGDAADAAPANNNGHADAAAAVETGSGILKEGAEVVLAPYAGAAPLRKRSLSGVRAYRLPNATNQLALLFSSHTDPNLSLTFGVELFEPGHVTNRHIHNAAYETFVVLGGEGVAFDNGALVPLKAGDVAVFPPHVVHAVDNPSGRRLYCLQMMLPNEMFSEYVTGGMLMGALDGGDVAGVMSGSC
jgi:quercetin dioxygenase-like cupin family protein